MSANVQPKAKKDRWPVKCIVVLTGICLFVSLLMAITNSLTAPVIAAGETQRAEQARIEVLPKADAFEEVELADLPESVTGVFKAKNGAGYVFMLKVKGYGGDMQIICGIGDDDRITACKTLSHAETAGLGAKTAADEYRSQYVGQDSSLSGVNAISGATISSKAYSSAVQDAFTALKLAKEAH